VSRRKARLLQRTPDPPFPAARLALIAIVVAGVLAYANSLHGAFLYDDSKHIVNNTRIRSLWPVWETITPPPNEGRPVVALTLAVNYATSGLETWSYHVFNVSVHILAALTLFGIVRRTLGLPIVSSSPGRVQSPILAREAVAVASAAALLFVVHPLQTQAVSYVIQRSESLAGLFYLLTLYAVIRSAAPGARPAWQAIAVAACAAGMATKQVMVTAPIVVLLYDRTFLSGGFREALCARRRLYLMLASTWALLVLLQWLSPNPGAGFERDVGPWAYGATQFGVIVYYLRLAFWPVGLCLDYAWPVATTAREIVPPALVVLFLVGATSWALYRRPAVGFCGAVFFLALAPSSTLLPISQLAAEHRMYLSLAALIVLVVAAVTTTIRNGPRIARMTAIAALGATVASGVVLTNRRNEDYRSAEVMWRDVIAKAPGNGAAYNNLAHALLENGQASEEAVGLLVRAIELDPEDWHPRKNLGDAYYALGRFDEAGTAYRASLTHRPDEAGTFEITYNLALVAIQQGDLQGGIGRLREAIALDPSHPRPYATLGAMLFDAGDLTGAEAHLQQAAAIGPTPSVLTNLGAIAAARGNREAAARYYRAALALDPGFARAVEGLREIEGVPAR
jgi:Flp pilus assembly protein TadD